MNQLSVANSVANKQCDVTYRTKEHLNFGEGINKMVIFDGALYNYSKITKQYELKKESSGWNSQTIKSL